MAWDFTTANLWQILKKILKSSLNLLFLSSNYFRYSSRPGEKAMSKWAVVTSSLPAQQISTRKRGWDLKGKEGALYFPHLLSFKLGFQGLLSLLWQLQQLVAAQDGSRGLRGISQQSSELHSSTGDADEGSHKWFLVALHPQSGAGKKPSPLALSGFRHIPSRGRAPWLAAWAPLRQGSSWRMQGSQHWHSCTGQGCPCWAGELILRGSFPRQCEFCSCRTHSQSHSTRREGAQGWALHTPQPEDLWGGTGPWSTLRLSLTRAVILWETRGKTNACTHWCTAGKEEWVLQREKVSGLVSDFTLLVKHTRSNLYTLFQPSCCDFQGAWLLPLDKHDYEYLHEGLSQACFISSVRLQKSVFSVSQ